MRELSLAVIQLKPVHLMVRLKGALDESCPANEMEVRMQEIHSQAEMISCVDECVRPVVISPMSSSCHKPAVNPYAHIGC